MFYTQKIKTVGTISEFVSGSFKEKKKMPKLSGSKLEKMVWVPVAGLTVSAAVKIKAAVAATGAAVVTSAPPIDAVPAGAISGAITNQVVHAFDPLVDLMVSLALPVASVIITGAALMVLIGYDEKGYPMMMRACIGYVLVQMVPIFVKLLAGIGAAI